MSILTKENQLKQTKGTFEARGKLFNLTSENAFKVNDKGNWRTVNLGLQISSSEKMFFTVKGGEKKEVYLSKRSEKKGEKPETKKVAWDVRKKECRGGWQAMGVNLGLTKAEDGSNELVSLIEWDAWEYLKENAKDGMSVFVAGEIEFSTYTDKDGNVKKNQNFVAKKIYLAKEEIDFQAEKFEKHAGFSQTFILVAPHKEESKDFGTQYFLEVSHVGFGSYESALVECTEAFYGVLKEKGAKRNWALTFTGIMKTSAVTEQVSVEDTWGEKSSIGSNKTPAKTTLLITGARGESLDKETYTQKEIDKYLEILHEVEEEKKKKAEGFTSQDGGGEWGDKSKITEEEEAW